MFKPLIIKAVGVLRENDWTNPRTNQVQKIKSLSIVVQDGADTLCAEAMDEDAVRLDGLSLKQGQVIYGDYFINARKVNTKEGGVFYRNDIRFKVVEVFPK